MNKSLLKTIIFYFVTVIASIIFFFLINKHGNLIHPTVDKIATAESATASGLFHVLLALVVIISTTRIIGKLFNKMNQPAVIGEIFGGILLGPSLLGYFLPGVMEYLFPQSILPMINIIAQIGILLYMYFVGLEIDLTSLKRSAHSTISISHMSIIFPFLLGTCLSLWLYETLAPVCVPFTSFSLFLGISMSITAFPVLARILTDQKMHKTPLGKLALTCAAIDDVSAWCLLAFVTSFARGVFTNAFWTLAWTALYILLMLTIAMPLMRTKLTQCAQKSGSNEGAMMTILLLVLVSSAFTEFIGIHALFGAFILGVITPHDNPIAVRLEDKLSDVIRFLFMPAFFAFTGLRTKFALVSTTEEWKWCGAIIAVAIIGKFGGTWIAARFSGINTRKSIGLGILMNTRGLVELIVLNIGLDIGVISQRLFAMLVIMALVTTVITGPALILVKRNGSVED